MPEPSIRAPLASHAMPWLRVPLPIKSEQLNKTMAILEVLREAGEPLSSADCASRPAGKNGVAADDPALPHLVTHVSAGLNSLLKRNRVRQVGTVDGRKHLWEKAIQGWVASTGQRATSFNARITTPAAAVRS